jgi:hypothetical protein
LRRDEGLSRADGGKSRRNGIRIRSEHREAPKEDTAVETGRVLKKRYRDWHLAESTAKCQRSGPGKIVDPVRKWLLLE